MTSSCLQEIWSGPLGHHNLITATFFFLSAVPAHQYQICITVCCRKNPILNRSLRMSTQHLQGNTSGPKTIGCFFADNSFRCIFRNEYFHILISISPLPIPIGPVNSKPSLVQIKTWCRTSDKSLSEPVMDYIDNAYTPPRCVNKGGIVSA